jgi:hypothetical protein
VAIHSRCHLSLSELNQLNDELIHINELESFFTMKPTQVIQLTFLLGKFEVLEDIWHIYKEYHLDRQNLNSIKITKIEPQPLIKKYELAVRKI